MEKLYITSLQNPQVKAWRALKDVKARAEQGLFLAEGDHLTGEALTAHAAAALLILVLLVMPTGILGRPEVEKV